MRFQKSSDNVWIMLGRQTPSDHLSELVLQLHDSAYSATVKAINRFATIRNYVIGFYIVEYEQHGNDRAKYGERLLKRLAERVNRRGMSLPGDVIRHFKYDLRFRIAADYDMAYRMWKQGIKFLYRDVPVARYEWGNGISSNPNKLLDVYRENAKVCHQEWSPLYWLKMMLEHYRLWKKRRSVI